MPEQTRQVKPARDDSKKMSSEEARHLARADADRQRKAPPSATQHTDELLEEIDQLLADTLEANETAEQFVRGYVQKGGQ